MAQTAAKQSPEQLPQRGTAPSHPRPAGPQRWHLIKASKKRNFCHHTSLQGDCAHGSGSAGYHRCFFSSRDILDLPLFHALLEQLWKPALCIPLIQVAPKLKPKALGCVWLYRPESHQGCTDACSSRTHSTHGGDQPTPSPADSEDPQELLGLGSLNRPGTRVLQSC